jgi:ATP-dependent protease ClpP protease subunit
VIAATTNTTMDKEPLFDNEELFALLDGRKPPKGAAGSENRILQAFENAGTGKKRATIHLYDGISFWTGNDARTFQSKLKEIQAEVIELRINSPGGSVFEGVTIYNLLIAHPARVEVKVDGLAGSIASVIMLAGDEVEVAENAMVMIHNPTVVAWGESTELRTMADALDRIKDAILNT